MATIGLIAGSGMQGWHDQNIESQMLETPYGAPSAAIDRFELNQVTVHQVARHGQPHTIPPHRVNYRANLWALKELGCEAIVAVNTVGGINAAMGPGTLMVPDQIIDLTWGRAQTFWDSGDDEPCHVDFTEPYDVALRQKLLHAAQAENLSMNDGGVYLATQGPRLETAAEIRHYRAMQADVVGMTGMPEAALARELGIPFAVIGVVVNWAAGLAGPTLDFIEIEQQQKACIQQVARVIWRLTNELTKIVTYQQ